MCEAVTIPFIAPIPSKKNGRKTQKATGRSFSSQRYVQWEKSMLFRISQMVLPESMPWERVGLEFDFVVGSKRVRDVDNMITSIFDVLKHKHAGVITEDSWANTPYGSWKIRYEKGVWAAKVTIIEESC